MSRPVLDLDTTGTAIAWPPRQVTGARAVGVRCAIALGTQRGLWAADQTFGLPITSWSVGVPLIVIQGQVRRLLNRIEGVIEVLSVTARREAGDLVVDATIRVQDDTGTATIRVATPTDAAIPGAWYSLISGIGFYPVAPARY